MKLFIISDLSDIHTKRWVSALAGRGIEIFLFGINKPDEEFYKKLKQVTVFSVDVFSKMQHPFRTGGIEKLKYLSVVKILRKKIQETQEASAKTGEALAAAAAGERALRNQTHEAKEQWEAAGREIPGELNQEALEQEYASLQ